MSASRRAAAPGRTEILHAATREFADHGYDGATTAGIARRAGVTQPLVHHHFGSKRGLWDAVVADLFSDLEAEFERTVAGLGDAPRERRLRALIRAVVRFSGKSVHAALNGQVMRPFMLKIESPVMRTPDSRCSRLT